MQIKNGGVVKTTTALNLGVGLVKSNIDLETIEVGLVNVMSREYVLKNYLDQVKNRINKDLKIDGVLLTLADMHTKVAKTTLETLQNNYGGKLKIYNTIIPQGVKAVEGTMAGKSFFTYDKNSKPAIVYDNFCKEVLKNEKQRIKNDFTQCR